MICKWCGAVMDRSDRACRRCGREVPALSDCGGFYDLAPAERPDIPVAVVETDSRQTRKRSSPLGVLCAVLAVLLAASVIVNLALAGQREAFAEELEELEERLEDRDESSLIPPATDAGTEDGTAATAEELAASEE